MLIWPSHQDVFGSETMCNRQLAMRDTQRGLARQLIVTADGMASDIKTLSENAGYRSWQAIWFIASSEPGLSNTAFHFGTAVSCL